jgi:hypothetical protein
MHGSREEGTRDETRISLLAPFSNQFGRPPRRLTSTSPNALLHISPFPTTFARLERHRLPGFLFGSSLIVEERLEVVDRVGGDRGEVVRGEKGRCARCRGGWRGGVHDGRGRLLAVMAVGSGKRWFREGEDGDVHADDAFSTVDDG